MSMSPPKVILLDRDGVLNRKAVVARYVRSWNEFEWMPGAIDAVVALKQAGYKVLVISNQAGLASGQVTEQNLNDIHRRMQEDLHRSGATIDAFYVCPHGEHEGCECRKPKPGLIRKAQSDFGFVMESTLFIGDDEKDRLAGDRAGCTTFLVNEKTTLLDIVRQRVLTPDHEKRPALKKRFEEARLYWRIIVSPHRALFASLVGLNALSSIFEMLSISLVIPIMSVLADRSAITENFVARFISSALSSWGIQPTPDRVIFGLITLGCALFTLRSALDLFTQYMMNAIGLKVQQGTRARLLDRFLRSSYWEIVRRNRGMIVSDINQPAEAMNVGFVHLGGLITHLVTCVVLASFMVYVAWGRTLAVAAVGAFILIVIRKAVTRLAAQAGQDIYEARRHQSRTEMDAIDGVRVVKSNVIESEMVNQYAQLLDAETRPMRRMVLYRYVPGLINELVASAVILLLGLLTLVLPGSTFSFASLVMLLMTMRRLAPAVNQVTIATVNLGKARKGLEVIDDLENRVSLEPEGQKEVSQIDTIQFSNVRFAYESRPEHDVLHQINLSLKRGSVTALVGSTGSGKSTLANMLVRLYKPTSGQILVNGIDFNEFKLSSWREKIGFLPQDIFLFNASIWDNIALWKPGITQNDVYEAAKLAQIHEFIMSLPQGYNTQVGDRGLRLSGGQCQRVAIARALVRKPDIFIFDEATSSLDNLTERAVYEAIQSLRSDAIVLIIAHRLTTVKEADEIVVLRGGNIIETGRHADLISQRGAYAALYQETAASR